MKSYTDISQSKKLAEFLPLESADMYYPSEMVSPKFGVALSISNNIPCWSLAALLDILPKIHGLKPILDLEECSIQYSGIDLYITASNPVDACYSMIINLNELNLL